jgi:hypothetical protein
MRLRFILHSSSFPCDAVKLTPSPFLRLSVSIADVGVLT